MSIAVHSTYSALGLANGPSKTALEVQLKHVQKEHSACVNCASAETQSGKENIQSLEIQMSQIQSQMQAVNEVGATADHSLYSSTGTVVDTYA